MKKSIIEKMFEELNQEEFTKVVNSFSPGSDLYQEASDWWTSIIEKAEKSIPEDLDDLQQDLNELSERLELIKEKITSIRSIKNKNIK